MTNATAANPDPVAAALAIVRTAGAADGLDAAGGRRGRPHGLAAVAALAAAVVFSLTAIAAMVSSPATIPMWCAAHGGCP